MLGDSRIVTPPYWTRTAKALTEALLMSDMTTRDDLLVQIVDEDRAEKMPIAWHVPATSDIVLNARKIKGMGSLRTLPALRLDDLATKYIGSKYPWGIDYMSGETLDEAVGDDDRPEKTMIRMRGVLAHEAAHSKWSHYILEPWFRKIAGEDPELAEIITMLDEVRIEGLQADYSDDLRKSMRMSARMLLPSNEDIEKMRDIDGRGIDMLKFSLNAALTLGRADQRMLLEYEVREFRHIVEDVVGFDRLQDMRSIWNDFAEIQNDEAEDAMPELAEEWRELFSGDDGGYLDLPGLLGLLAELFGLVADDAEKWAGNTKQSHAPDDMADSAEEAAKVFKTKEKHGEHVYSHTSPGDTTRRKPKPQERAVASQLAKRLERLSTRARSETKVRSVVPPGRLKSRAAVQQAAARSQGRASVAEPWARTVRKHNDSPPLTVGVATDVSGSMSWAENMVASFSWVVSKAVRHVNGKTAAVVFGSKAEPTYGPGDKLEEVIVREANDGSEAFNSGVAALDGLLRLSDPSNGARILFVVSDGYLVAEGEMPAAAKWVEKLTKSGCVVVWINNTARSEYEYEGYKPIPKGATYVQASDAGMGTINKMMDEVAKVLASR